MQSIYLRNLSWLGSVTLDVSVQPYLIAVFHMLLGTDAAISSQSHWPGVSRNIGGYCH
jgi:hypothetical protein